MTSPGLRRRANPSDSISSSSTAANSLRAFYQLPEDKPTAAQIVRESRDWLRSVSTRRPFTPKDNKRSLFGSSQPRLGYRPSSALKFVTSGFEQCDTNRPLQNPHLAPIPDKPTATDTKSSKKPRSSRAVEVKTSHQNARHPVSSVLLPSYRSPNSFQLNSSGSTPPINGDSASPRLELVGTQTRLISPVLSQPINRISTSEELRNRTKYPIQSSHGSRPVRKEEEAKQQIRNSSSPNRKGLADNKTRPQSGNKSPLQSSSSLHSARSVHTITQSSIDSFLSARPPSPVNLNFVDSSTDFEVESHNSLGILSRLHGVRSAGSNTDRCPNKLDPLVNSRKPKSSGPQTKYRAQPFNRPSDVNSQSSATSVSCDSGVSSGNELDHLISRLSELALVTKSSPIGRERMPDLEIVTEEDEYQLGKPQKDNTIQPDETSVSSSSHILLAQEDEAIELVDRIYKTIRESNMHGKKHWPKRTCLLKAVFNMMDYPSPRLHLALARVILTVQVSGVNRVNVCKLVYHVAKDSHNDHLFLEHDNILELLVESLALLDIPYPLIMTDQFTINERIMHNVDAVVFLTGSLKFLLTNSVLSKKICSIADFILILANLHRQIDRALRQLHIQFPLGDSIKSQNQEVDNQTDFRERLYTVLVQLTEIFCRLTCDSSLRSKLIQQDGAMELILDCLSCPTFNSPLFISKQSRSGDAKNCSSFVVYFNWIRFLSRLTEHADACTRIDLWGSSSLQVKEDNNSDPSQTDQTIKSNLPDKRLLKYALTRMTNLCQSLMLAMQQFKNEYDLVVRIAYVLGNLAARSDQARKAILPNMESLNLLCNLCYSYCSNTNLSDGNRTISQKNIVAISNLGKAWIDESQASNPDAITCSNEQFQKSVTSSDLIKYDILVKLIRILANAAIAEPVGYLASISTESVDLILQLIETDEVNEPTELLLNCLATLNNLTYYMSSQITNDVRHCEIAQTLLHVIKRGVSYDSVLLGVIRVFGNLTRHLSVREWLAGPGGQILMNSLESKSKILLTQLPDSVNAQNIFLYLLIQNLDSSRPELVYSTLGVMINLMTDIDQRPMLRELGGLSKLVEGLKDFAGHDWQLAGLICKTFWNYTETCSSLKDLIDPETLSELSSLLVEFTDEEFVNQIHQGLFTPQTSVWELDSLSLCRSAWSSEFLPVAEEFLNRLSEI